MMSLGIMILIELGKKNFWDMRRCKLETTNRTGSGRLSSQKKISVGARRKIRERER